MFPTNHANCNINIHRFFQDFGKTTNQSIILYKYTHIYINCTEFWLTILLYYVNLRRKRSRYILSLPKLHIQTNKYVVNVQK